MKFCVVDGWCFWRVAAFVDIDIVVVVWKTTLLVGGIAGRIIRIVLPVGGLLLLLAVVVLLMTLLLLLLLLLLLRWKRMDEERLRVVVVVVVGTGVVEGPRTRSKARLLFRATHDASIILVDDER